MNDEQMDQQVRVPLTDFVRQIAREAALVVITEHFDGCEARKTQTELFTRIRSLEISRAKLVGFMAGASALGGGAGALVAKLLGG